MEIYKLSSTVGLASPRSAPAESQPDTIALTITDIKQAVHNENRVNVYVNGKYSFSLDIAQVVDMGVKIGRVLTAEELADFKRASEFGKLYQRTLEWVLTRPRSERETRDYLYKKIREKNLDRTFIDEIIQKLFAKNYLNDEKFAAYYIENRFTKKGISAKRLKLELMKKGIGNELVDEILDQSPRTDEAEIKKIIKRKRTKYDDDKLIQYLCRQGFDYALSRELVQSFETDSQNSE